MMKKYYSYCRLSIIFFIMMLFAFNKAWCQIGVAQDYFESLSIVGDTTYIDIVAPPEFSTISRSSPMESNLLYPRHYLRAVDISNPRNPLLINNIERNEQDPYYYNRREILHEGFIYSVTGEEFAPYTDYGPPGEEPPFQAQTLNATFSIAKIENNEKITPIKSISLTNTLNSLRATTDPSTNQQNIFVTPTFKIFDHYAYIIFNENILQEVPDEYAMYGYIPPPEQGIALVMLDISNPHNPSIVSTRRIMFDTIMPSGGNAIDFIVSGTLLYMLTSSYDSSHVHIFNISSPQTVSELSSLKVYGREGKIALRGNILFLAMGNFGLEIIDVRDPSAPALIGWFETPAPYLGYSMKTTSSIIVHDNNVYLLDSEDGLIIFDVSDPTSPYPFARYAQDTSLTERYSQFLSMTLHNNYLFLLSPTYIDIISIHDPTSPKPITIIGEKEPGQLIITLRIEAMNVLALRTENGLQRPIALFDIPSLDQLNRKYGVFKIIRNYEQMYRISDDESVVHEPTIEEILNNRYLREFTLLFPESIDIEAIREDYKKNPYVITARSSLYGPYGYAPVYSSTAYGGMAYGSYTAEPLTYSITNSTSSASAPVTPFEETIPANPIRSDYWTVEPSVPITLPQEPNLPYVTQSPPIPVSTSQPFPPVVETPSQLPLSGVMAMPPLFAPASSDALSRDIFNPLLTTPPAVPPQSQNPLFPLPAGPFGIADPLANFNDPLWAPVSGPNPFGIAPPFGML
ncbi:MAG: hypothetical protein ACMUJM_25580 [bacterium]